MVGSAWEDLSFGPSLVGETVIGLACEDHPRHGGGTRYAPSRIRVRISAERPDPSDEGDVFELEGRKFREIYVAPGMKLWAKAHEGAQRGVLVQSA